jgi:hypothetical protein
LLFLVPYWPLAGDWFCIGGLKNQPRHALEPK